ncbi:MAG: TetR family transcriptional regulator [Gammaproteobacteria bacterium]|nr:TetR family transcriptional regulator [Gammaproteobacteria bacterium]
MAGQATHLESSAADTVRDAILDAADTRFQQYGYRKTTMAEIAQDVRMSAANLYRYFGNKQDIAAACCDRWMVLRLDGLRTVLKAPISAAEKLHRFVFTGLMITRQMSSEQPKVYEVVEMVMHERPSFVHKKIDAMESLIAEILADGNRTGEFEVDDVVATARFVHASILLYEVPLFAQLFSDDEFEESAAGVVALILNGLRRRPIQK